MAGVNYISQIISKRTNRLLRYLSKMEIENNIESNLTTSFSDAMLKLESKVFPCSLPSSVKIAAELLNKGEVIALPTDTVYGLACSANNPSAIQKLYAVKGRAEEKPVAICVADISDVRLWGESEHLPDELLTSLLPGPVTIILDKTKHLDNPFLNPGIKKIGIRIPDYAFIRAVARLEGLPIALTSANLSSEPSTLSITEFKSLWPKLTAVFNGGVIAEGDDCRRAASTVVDLSEPGYYKILRDGVALIQTVSTLHKFGFQLSSL